MNMQALMERALTFPAACAESPFGPECVCIRVGEHGPIFANFFLPRGWVSFRCEMMQGQIWRSQFPGTVRRGYHCPPVQQPYNNTVTLDGTVPDSVLMDMLDHSYHRAVKTMTKARRLEVLGHL